MRNFSRFAICTAILVLVIGVAAVSAQEPARPDPSVDQSQQQAQPEQQPAQPEQQAQPQQPAQPVDQTDPSTIDRSKIDQSKVDDATKTQTERTDMMKKDETETAGSELPRTASNILLAALGGFLSLGGGLYLRTRRRS